jgi:hypothetical protein
VGPGRRQKRLSAGHSGSLRDLISLSGISAQRHQYGTDTFDETAKAFFVSSNLSVPTSGLTTMARPDDRLECPKLPLWMWVRSSRSAPYLAEGFRRPQPPGLKAVRYRTGGYRITRASHSIEMLGGGAVKGLAGRGAANGEVVSATQFLIGGLL